MQNRDMLLVAGLLFVVGCSTTSPPKVEPASVVDMAVEEHHADTPDAIPAEWPLMAIGPVAIIDGVEIPASSFNKRVEVLVRVAPYLPPQALQKFTRQSIDHLIDERVVENMLLQEDISAGPSEVERERSAFYDTVGGAVGLKEFFEKSGMTEQEVLDDIVRTVKVKKYLKKNYGLEITVEKARVFYTSHLDRFTQPEEVEGSHILLRTDAGMTKAQVAAKKKKAKQILKKAQAKDADFAALAGEYSEDLVHAPRGELGFFTRGRMVSTFTDPAFGAKIGEVIGPVRTEFGFHIIKVTDRRPQITTPFEEVKDQISQELETREARALSFVLVKDLRAKSKIEDLAKTAVQENPNYKPPIPAQ